MELKGSQTEKNLFEAFTGESRARNKYLFYAFYPIHLLICGVAARLLAA